MSIVYRTTVTPSKTELLSAWLPSRPWYRGGGGPELAKAGGFRLDDPEGEVGIEFLVVQDPAGAAYLAPLTYRGAPLPGAGDALIGTMEHGVLGARWCYDGTRDPVLAGQVAALLSGNAVPQMQSVNDTPDPDVRVGKLPEAAGLPGVPVAGLTADDDADGTVMRIGAGLPVRVHRVIAEADTGDSPGPGQVSALWRPSEETRARAVFLSAVR